MLTTDVAATDGTRPDDPGRSDAGARVGRPRRLRFRLGTLLFVVAILALLLVAAIQQFQLALLRETVRAQQRKLATAGVDRAKLSAIIREQRDMLGRDSGGRGSNEHKGARKEQ